MTKLSDAHDVVAYPAFAYQNTHPSQLAAVARLHGLQPAPVEACRVLEIGCNAGANLIPMAYSLPASDFVGFDLAGVPVQRGQKKIEALGLRNIRLLQADLIDADGMQDLRGPFDYIIAHGVYAWVPDAVREALLGFCQKHLSARGVAFISYAALPGGYARLLSREVMQFRTAGQRKDAAAGVSEGMRFMEFIANTRPEGDGFRALLQRELNGLAKRNPSVAFHDELSEAYRPVSFREFASHAAQHSLRYFSEAELPSPNDPCFQPETAATIQQLAGGDIIAQEQMFDFVRMRQYRESLLCHAGSQCTYDVQTDALRALAMSTQARSSEGRSPSARAYTLQGGVQIETEHPVTLAVLELLIARAPEAVRFEEIAARLEGMGFPAGPELLVLLMRLAVSRMIDLQAWVAPVTREIGDKPVASGLCRADASTETSLVTPLHTVLDNSDPIARKLIQLLDGTRDRVALLKDWSAALPDVPMEALADGMEPALEVLSRAGVLVTQ